jgi:hypothetical protein
LCQRAFAKVMAESIGKRKLLSDEEKKDIQQVVD